MKDSKNLEEHQPEQENQPMPIAAEVQESPRNNPEVCVQVLKDPEDLSAEELQAITGGLRGIISGTLFVAGGVVVGAGTTYGIMHHRGHPPLPDGGVGIGGGIDGGEDGD